MIATVFEDAFGDAIIELSDDMVNKLGLEVGDSFDVNLVDGLIVLTKIKK